MARVGERWERSACRRAGASPAGFPAMERNRHSGAYMATNLALDLSQDAVRLLHDTGAGWVEICAAHFDSADLATDLASLRSTAVQVGGDAFETLLILPDNQILYTSASASGLDEVADKARIETALQGATPYPVAELVYDWHTEDDRLRIAVVARETLQEAEAFTTEHGLNPIGHTARPQPDRFGQAPWFGATAHARSTRPEATTRPDIPAIEIVGKVTAAALASLLAELAAEAQPDPTPQAAEPEPASSDTPASGQPDSDAKANASETAETAPNPEPCAPPAPSAQPDTADAPQDSPIATDESPTAPTPEKAAEADVQPPQDSAPPAADSPSPLTFSSRRRAATSAASSTETPAAQADTPAPASKAPAPSAKKPKAGSKAAKPPAKRKAPKAKAAKAPPAKPKAPKPLLGFASIRSKAPATPDPDTDVTAEGQPPATPPSIEKTPLPPTLEEPKAPALVAARPDTAPKEAGLSGFLATTASSLSAAPAPKPDPRAEEEEALTTFGARKEQRLAQAGSPPGRAGLIAVGSLILLLMVLGIWANFAYRAEIEAWWRGDAPQSPTELAIATPDRVAAPTPAPSLPETDAGTRATVDGDAPPSLLPVLPGRERPDGAAEATAIQLPATGLGPAVTPDLPRAPETGVADQRLARLPAPTAQPSPGTSAPTAELPFDDPDFTDLLDDEEPEVVLMSPEETAAQYAATGIWQAAPPRPEPSDETGLNQLYLTSIDPVIRGSDAVDLPRNRRFLRDDALQRQSPPLPPGSDILLGADGLVTPTPDGTRNPDGILVIAGRPTIEPPRRPGAAEETAPSSPPGTQERLAGFRPLARPDTLSETAQRTRLGGRTLEELASLRPLVRPDAVEERAAALLAERAEEARREEEDLAVKARAEAAAAGRAGASPLAVKASLIPRARPAGLPRPSPNADQDDGQDEGRSGPALQRAQRLQPDNPTPVSVARQATVENGIRLGRVNLLGVFGTPNDRRALVRMPSGRVLNLKIGDRLDGGRVAAIGDGELRYTKGGRNITLRMPRG